MALKPCRGYCGSRAVIVQNQQRSSGRCIGLQNPPDMLVAVAHVAAKRVLFGAGNGPPRKGFVKPEPLRQAPGMRSRVFHQVHQVIVTATPGTLVD
jgi:hypothetical protein